MIYLAQPYSYKSNAYLRHKRYLYAVKKTATFLNQGHAIFSPIIQTHQMALFEKLPTNFDFWKKLDFAFIEASKEVWVLKMKGWDKSQGVTEEIKFAEMLGKPIKYIDCPDSPKEYSTPDLTYEYLKECLDYQEDTGIFTWKRRPLSHFQSLRSHNIWNTKYAGKIASNKNSHGYCRIVVNNEHYMGHRLAYLYMTGENPHQQIDHINHDRGDNRWVNLRNVEQQQNQMNLGKRVNNKSGITGVCWSARDRRWLAQITVKQKHYNLGQYENIFDAACARRSAELKYKFHENHGQDKSNKLEAA